MLRSARFAHRLALRGPGRSATTICVTGPRIRSWGFHCPGGRWVPGGNLRLPAADNPGTIGPGCEG